MVTSSRRRGDLALAVLMWRIQLQTKSESSKEICSAVLISVQLTKKTAAAGKAEATLSRTEPALMALSGSTNTASMAVRPTQKKTEGSESPLFGGLTDDVADEPDPVAVKDDLVDFAAEVDALNFRDYQKQQSRDHEAEDRDEHGG